MRAVGILGERRAFLTVALAYLGLAAKLSGLPIIFNIYGGFLSGPLGAVLARHR